jgi:hypothetical protein
MESQDTNSKRHWLRFYKRFNELATCMGWQCAIAEAKSDS